MVCSECRDSEEWRKWKKKLRAIHLHSADMVQYRTHGEGVPLFFPPFRTLRRTTDGRLTDGCKWTVGPWTPRYLLSCLGSVTTSFTVRKQTHQNNVYSQQHLPPLILPATLPRCTRPHDADSAIGLPNPRLGRLATPHHYDCRRPPPHTRRSIAPSTTQTYPTY